MEYSDAVVKTQDNTDWDVNVIKFENEIEVTNPNTSEVIIIRVNQTGMRRGEEFSEIMYKEDGHGGSSDEKERITNTEEIVQFLEKHE